MLPGSGTVLFDPTSPYVTRLVAASQPFAIPVPPECEFVGATFYSQALSFDAGGTMQLTNAIDFTVGVF